MDNTFTNRYPHNATQFMEHVDVDYGYDLAQKLGTFRTNETLGFRTVGSFAEHEAADFLELEMAEIGLQKIKRYSYPVTSWTFKHASLRCQTESQDLTFTLSAYPSHIDTQGPQTIEIIDVGRSDSHDFPSDISGKWILIDINQREDWWINYPATEAFYRGALGIIAVQDGGYGEISDHTLNAQNTSIPHGAVALSMSRHDARILRQALKVKPTLTLDVSSLLDPNGTAYNVFGCIPGESDEIILMSAHYDAYFEGFQDNSVAVGLMMGIAKALCSSGIKPKKTLMFGALSAEEWGATDTRYDWLTGSYTQMRALTPEWVDMIFANINFELPAMLEDGTDWIRASYELKRYLSGFTLTLPQASDVYPNGIRVLNPIETWSDDFSFEIFGIPSTVSALKPKFAASHYHTQFDTVDTYHEGAFLYHHYVYGLLMLQYDDLAVLPLDFSERIQALKQALDLEMASEYIDINAFKDLVITISNQSNALYTLLTNISGTGEHETLKQQVRKIFRFAATQFLRLSWEDDVLFPFEQNQTNVRVLEHMLYDPKRSMEYVSLVDNNKYAVHWSSETYHYHTQNVLSDTANMMWGTAFKPTHCDLFDFIDSHDFEIIEQAVESERSRYDTVLNEVMANLYLFSDQIQTCLDLITKKPS